MKNFRQHLTPFALAATLGAPVAQAFDTTHPFYLAPMASYVLADDDRGTGNAYGGVLALGMHLSEQTEVELRGSYLRYGGKNGNPSMSLKNGGMGANFFLFRGRSGSGLYLHGDVMGFSKATYSVGLGYDFLFSDSGFGLRAEALNRVEEFHRHEPQFNLGVRIPFGARPVAPLPPAPPPPPPPVEEAVIPEPLPPPPPPPPPPCVAPESGQPIDLTGCVVGDSIVLRGVNFDFDKDTLTVNAKTILDQVVEALLKRPDITVEIDGHTDAKGSDAYNMNLSDRRAATVSKYLVAHGIEARRLSSKGFGESQPVADNVSDEGRELNRRVELKVIGADPNYGAVSVAPPVPTKPVAAPTAASVSIADYMFSPASLTVTRGSTVTWTNRDATTHTVEFPDTVTTIRLAPGETYSRSYDAEGEFDYVCGIHPSMKGTVVVSGP